MKFEEIDENNTPVPGQYLFYEPASAIVLCTAFVGETIKAFLNGKLIEDKTPHFKKVLMTRTEQKTRGIGGCKGCGR